MFLFRSRVRYLPCDLSSCAMFMCSQNRRDPGFHFKIRQLFQPKFHFGCLKITNVKSLFSFNAESFRKFIDMYPLILRNRFAKRDFDLRNSFSKKFHKFLKFLIKFQKYITIPLTNSPVYAFYSRKKQICKA